MRFWFAKIKDSGEYIVNITKSEFAEAGKRTILNGLEVIGLGSYEFLLKASPFTAGRRSGV